MQPITSAKYHDGPGEEKTNILLYAQVFFALNLQRLKVSMITNTFPHFITLLVSTKPIEIQFTIESVVATATTLYN